MCRKGFNPERIKKLHVDKAPGEGSVPTGPMAEENELLRRVGMLFDEGADPADVDTVEDLRRLEELAAPGSPGAIRQRREG